MKTLSSPMVYTREFAVSSAPVIVVVFDVIVNVYVFIVAEFEATP